MRFPATMFAAVLAAGMFAGAEVTPCRADATTETTPAAAAQAPDSPDPPVPGTEEEERSYAQREAASPAVQEFSGGFVVALLFIVALVLVIILLAREI